jgi:iron complex transport system substrate-binding protein
VKIGHGPATVIGRLGRKSGHPLRPLQADTLRERECGLGAPSPGLFYCLLRSPNTFMASHAIIGIISTAVPVRGAVSIKDTRGRIHLAQRRAPLVRWMFAGLLRFAGLVAASGVIAPLLLSGATARQAVPSDRTMSDASHIELKDETGRAVRIPRVVRRIVSLAPSVTETLFALGLGDRVVGDTNFCDYPPEARTKVRIGGPINPNIEAIAALHPDLVVATRSINRPASVRSLEQLGIPVYATDPHTVEQVLTSTQRLGELLDAGDAGRSLAADLDGRLSALDQRLAGLPPKNVLMVIWLDPLISVGHDTFLEDALRRAGAHSVIDTRQSWPNVNLEQVIRLQPDYLVFSSDDPQQVQRQFAELQQRPGWRRLEAVRNRRFIVVSEAISHPSPRLVDGIEQLARALYPSQFSARAAGMSGGVSLFPAFVLAQSSGPIFLRAGGRL